MKLSILIPLYNKEKYIERCLKSLLTQDISPNEYEIIIVDDGSKDSGALIVQNASVQKTLLDRKMSASQKYRELFVGKKGIWAFDHIPFLLSMVIG